LRDDERAVRDAADIRRQADRVVEGPVASIVRAVSGDCPDALTGEHEPRAIELCDGRYLGWHTRPKGQVVAELNRFARVHEFGELNRARVLEAAENQTAVAGPQVAAPRRLIVREQAREAAARALGVKHLIVSDRSVAARVGTGNKSGARRDVN